MRARAWRAAMSVGILFCGLGGLHAQSPPAAGKALYDRRCALCHGSDGAPQASVAKMLKTGIPHLGLARVQSLSDAAIHKLIKEGSGKMKAVKGIADQDIARIILYLRTFQKP